MRKLPWLLTAACLAAAVTTGEGNNAKANGFQGVFSIIPKNQCSTSSYVAHLQDGVDVPASTTFCSVTPGQLAELRAKGLAGGSTSDSASVRGIQPLINYTYRYTDNVPSYSPPTEYPGVEDRFYFYGGPNQNAYWVWSFYNVEKGYTSTYTTPNAQPGCYSGTCIGISDLSTNSNVEWLSAALYFDGPSIYSHIATFQ